MKKLIYLSIIITITYLLLCFYKYGMQTSISAYANDWIDDGLQFMPFLWVLSMYGTIGIYSLRKGSSKYSWILFLAVNILTLIGFFTGHNPDFENNAIENGIHVSSVYVSIGMAIIYMIISCSKKIWPVILSVLFFIFTITFVVLDISNHTYWIEIFCLGIIYIYLHTE